jgi:hypothetical protein
MPVAKKKTILFTGYAPVHFACFRPIYEQLTERSGVEVFVSGGIRTMGPLGVRFDHAGLYESFGLPPEAVVPVERIKRMNVDVLFSAHTGRIEPASFERSVQIFHGVSFRNLAIREQALGFDHYFLVGPYMRRGFEQRGLLEPGDQRAVEIGFPKTDRLLDGSMDREALLAAHGLSGERPVVLYAPTGAKANSLETFGEEVLRRLAEQDSYDVLVKLHDHPKGWVDWFERLAPLEGEHLRIVRTPDIIPTLFIADLLVSDASSVANEYTLLDRPIVFLDVPELIDAARDSGALVDLDTWGRNGGTIAASPDTALDAIAEGLARPRAASDVRQAIAADLFYNPGQAALTAAKWLEAELDL